MQYNRLPKLTNKYPQTGNYITTGVGQSSLFGLYSDVNKVDFKLESLEDVTIVPDTKMRTILADIYIRVIFCLFVFLQLINITR